MSNSSRSTPRRDRTGSARPRLRPIPSILIGLVMTSAVLPVPGHAQDPGRDSSMQQTGAEEAVETTIETIEAPELKSPAASTRTSLAATVVPTAAGIGLFAAGVENPLLAFGLYLGPATGYWTGGVGSRGWAGVGLRSGIGVGGGLLALALCGDGWGCENEGAVTAVLLATGAGLIASAVHDIASVDDHVTSRNEELRKQKSTSVSVIPTVSPADGGTLGFTARVAM